MKRWQAFNTICDHLRTGLLGGWSLGWHSRAPWESVVEISSQHFVTPALAWCLKDKAFVPADVRDYFDAMLSLNGTRNKHIAEGLARVVAALNTIDIEPVLLKGAAYLVEGIYPLPAVRLVGDLDLLVPADRAGHAAAALADIGFIVPPEAIVPASHHHLPMMREPGSGLAVELHTRVEHIEARAVVPVGWFCEHARPFQFRGLRTWLPEPTRDIGLNVVHSQLNHEGYKSGRAQLRQLLDLAMIRARHEQAIDWTELDRRFSEAGCGQVLATYLKFGETLFGQRMPRLSTTPRARALARFRVSLERPERQLRAKRRVERRVARRVELHAARQAALQRRADQVAERQAARERRRAARERRAAYWNRIATMPLYYVAARRRDPAAILDLFRSKTWPGRLRRLRDAFRPPS